ncbi:PAS-domain containing protein [Erythrobacter sp. SCSIO 43205]|uniref:PAS domain-containing sensor histidine kinase n=1 Tax=Erythrobacter sp. SCSIO 43205 TaxID=2779361 RepID=UPI001CA82910|nr:PAS domain-containing sensor histidine kinase [Erythrobacter sp. SCSIO 43205]UAB76919.1 PAS-domain containing protein [Erythrobacter sp. SCSIO 43205]
MELTPPALVIIVLVLAAWTVAAAVMMLRASAKVSRAKALKTSLRRMQHLIEVSPAIPLLVRTDGRIEAPDRLARWFGLKAIPTYLSELAGEGEEGLSKAQAEELWDKARATQKSAAPFSMTLTPPGSKRCLALEGSLADPAVSPGGAAIVWVFDFTASESELAELRSQAAHAKSDFAALSGLIASAPTPMWIRDPDMKLRLANEAYIKAVGADSLEAVIEGQIELLEARDGRSPSELARDAFTTKRQLDRIDGVTIDGERRSMRVTDLPLGEDGVAGYAIDVEEQQQVARDFRAFREAQRAMLDQLSIGVAQFAPDETLSFANRPFRRLFGLFSSDSLEGKLAFDRLLSDARERGQTPEVRDFPEWREEHRAWFDAQETLEEYWPLPGGTHLRIVAQPLPDGGLVMIAEDRTEQLELSATRDTLLRTRTATLDSLFEALAIFAPDGSVQIWNRTFARTWGISSDLLDTHPSAEGLFEAIGANLANPEEVETLGAVVRAATLDRREKKGQVVLADGRTLRFAGVPLPDGNGLLTVLDITDSQKAEAALRERAIALEEADAVKARFLANMSYEFRTPLTTIGGFAELLASGVAGDLSEQAGEYVDAILTSVARLTEQVENVLDLSQTEAGLMPITKESVDLLTFLAELVRERETAIVKAGLGLDLKGRRGRVVDADTRQLGRAIGNLIDNAIAGTPQGGQITIELPKPARDDDWRGRVIIRDDGNGMTPEQLERAMGALPEGEEPGDNGGEGTGLGIRLAHQLVAAHGGTLELDSQLGVGTIAVITLP